MWVLLRWWGDWRESRPPHSRGGSAVFSENPMTGSHIDVIGLERLRFHLDDLREQYASAAPFPHVVIDDVLPADVFAAAVAEFPPVDDPSWNGYLHVNETKFANHQIQTWGPTLRAIAGALVSDDFVKVLGDLTGFEHLIADPSMDGGGLHQTLRGGFLNVHTDFTTHHVHRNWRRHINVLVYLNEHWSREWGGALELWDSDVMTRVSDVEPIGNRILIFTTSVDACHGHPDPLRCPPDVARRSLALYYFTDEEGPVRRSTRYHARPGDGIKGAAIWGDRHLLSLYDVAKTRFGLSDRVVSSLLGGVHRARSWMQATSHRAIRVIRPGRTP